MAILQNAILGLAISIFLPLSASAQGDDLRLIDTGWLSDGQRGNGIAMIVVAKALPEQGLSGFDEIGQNICNAFAPTVVPFVLEKTGNSDPAFIALTIRHGTSNFGAYWREFYRITDGKCGDPF